MTRLKILFVNRMAGLVRGGGETFDLEISRALEKLGCEVHYLTGAPMFRKAPLPVEHANVHYIHSPYLPWFPWDKIKAGWRIKVWEFQWFERRAAKWIQKHAHEFDVIQVCELPYLVKLLKGLQVSGFRLRKAFGGQARLKVEGDEGVRSSVFSVRGRGEEGEAAEGEEDNVKLSTFKAQLSSGETVEGSRLKVEGEGVEGEEDNVQHSTSNTQHSKIETTALFGSSRIPNILLRPKGFGGQAEHRNPSSQSKIHPPSPYGLRRTRNPKSKIVLRLTAPNAYDPWGGIQLADAVIASGTSIEKIRAKLRPDVVDVPNGVDLERFQVEGFRLRKAYGGQARLKGEGLKVEGEEGPETRDQRLETEDKRLKTEDARNLARTPNTEHRTPYSQSQIVGFRETHCIPPTAPVLLYVARFQAFKNHKLLIEAFSKVLLEVPEARLMLAGSGPLMKEIKVLCGEMTVNHSLSRTQNPEHRTPDHHPLPRTPNPDLSAVGFAKAEHRTPKPAISDRVLFLGETPFDQLPEVYAAADVKVISSEYESFCFAAIEAMACGLPVITTDCGWVPKLIGDELPVMQKQWAHGGDKPGRFEVEKDGERIREVPGGLVVSRQEAESLAKAMVRMIGDEEMRERCGRWNREKAVREHGWESSARKLLGVYDNVLAG